MHELAVCQGVIGQVARIAARHGASGVERIRVRIGPLSGVEPPLLERAFPIAAAGTVAAAAQLEVEIESIRVRCRTCGACTEAAPNRLLCGACGDWHTELLSGDEMILESVALLGCESAAAVGGQDV